ncbi:MAG: hypothetical protein AAF565_17915 [Pseudomonadota bacterium]
MVIGVSVSSRLTSPNATRPYTSAATRNYTAKGAELTPPARRLTRVIAEIVRPHPLVLSTPEPTIRVTELGASSGNFICRQRTRTSDYWSVYWDLTHRVKTAFDEAGISIPYPQQDVPIKTRTA